MDWTSPEGEVISSDKLTLPSDPPRSYAYCSDTTYDPGIAKMIEGTDTLYHECTYADEERGRARKHFHSTASEAASIARDAHARQLVLGHFSARYDNETAMLKQARAIFPNSVLAAEGKVIDI